MLSCSLKRFLQSVNRSELPFRLCSTIDTKIVPTTEKSTVQVEEVAKSYLDTCSIGVSGRVTNIFVNRNGSVTFFLKSMSAGNFSKVHKICVSHKSHALLALVKGKLALHQKVYVEGLLNNREFQTETGQHRTTSQVMAGDLRILEDFAVASDDANQIEKTDANSVEILGYITAGITAGITGDEYRTFELAHLKNPRLSKQNQDNFLYNQVFVYDQSLFPFLDKIKLHDSVLVRGEISYRIHQSEHGKTMTSSYITAKQLYRIC